jgi:uncharacterized membrane protein required for colicin V production
MMKYLQDLTVPWVDLLVLVLLIVGVFRGRKNGLSSEFLDVIKWVLIVAVGGLFHRALARYVGTFWPGLSPLGAYVLCYIAIGLVIAMVFASIKRAVGEKISEKDVFGIAEFYVGMLAGAVRFGCIILACMALLHARQYTQAEITASEKAQDDNFGSIRFFRLYRLQGDVFNASYSGRAVGTFLEPLLIPSTPPGGGTLSQPETAARIRERRVNEVLDH